MLKLAVKKFLHSRGLKLSRVHDISTFLAFHQVDFVVDVGANAGQFAQELRDFGYGGPIRSFEPVRATFDRLSAAARQDSNWDVVNAAVGAEAGEADIHVSENTLFSSFRDRSQVAKTFHPDSVVSRTEKVPVVRLDDALADSPAQRLFLKIDTQGFEKPVLAGATKTLERCVGLQMELPVEHLYEGVWSFAEAIGHMADLGFVPAQFKLVVLRGGDPSSGAEFDCIFRRAA